MSKYGAQSVVVDGHRFPSKREAARYRLLKLRAAAGDIEGLELQPRYPLVVNGVKVAVYVADFRYREAGAVVVEDVKGVRTPVYRLKKKLVSALYGFTIKET